MINEGNWSNGYKEYNQKITPQQKITVCLSFKNKIVWTRRIGLDENTSLQTLFALMIWNKIWDASFSQ